MGERRKDKKNFPLSQMKKKEEWANEGKRQADKVIPNPTYKYNVILLEIIRRQNESNYLLRSKLPINLCTLCL